VNEKYTQIPPSADRARISAPLGIAALLLCAASRAADVLPPEVSGHIEREVRQFMQAVAADVTTHGPTAWQAYMAQTPAFFMAADGQLRFASPAAASSAIAELPKSIRQIGLKWGDDLRVDPLTAIYAVVGTSFAEKLVAPDGTIRYERGYLTAVLEAHAGHWTFRDAHWSSLPAGAGPAGKKE
jgi:hypothetical protein